MSYVYEVQGLYTRTYGWEAVFTTTTIEEAKAILADYQKSERVPFRIKKVKEKEGAL